MEKKKHSSNIDNEAVLELLEALATKMDKLDTRLTAIESSTSRMDNHISFVNTVYDQLRTPLDTVRRMVNSLPFTNCEDDVKYITLGQEELDELPPSAIQE